MAETNIPREALYIADEVFFTGTAAELTPIRSIDKITIGTGKRGPVTAALQSAFFAVINGDVPDTHGWLTYVYPEEASLREPTWRCGREALTSALSAPGTASRLAGSALRGGPDVLSDTRTDRYAGLQPR